MAQTYAKDQPAGFTNRIERVAIVGAGGQVGKHIAEELMKTGKHTVTAVSRFGSQSPLPKGIKVANVDYENEQSLIDALQGQQFLIISMSISAPPDTQVKLTKAAAKAGVPWIMPNGYGSDPTNVKYISENNTSRALLSGIQAVEEHSTASWVVMSCQHWYEYSLTTSDAMFGFDYKNKKATFYSEGGKRPIATSTWLQCGRAAAALLSLNELPEDENDQSLTLSRWRNKAVYISSFKVSQRDMLDSVERVTNTTDKDWTIAYEPAQERWERGRAAMGTGDFNGFVTSMYARCFFDPSDTDVGEKNDNDRLGLPDEDFDEATKRAVGLWESGYNAFARKQ